MPHDQRLAAHLQQGFGRVVGERAHAFAAAGGEDHGGFDRQFIQGYNSLHLQFV
jgi:hypothetical protein